MAKKSGSTISQEELYPLGDESAREELDDARLLDLEADQESPFLRAQKRVSVRRNTLPKKTATHLTWGVLALGAILVLAIAASAAYRYGEHSWRFRIESSDDLEINGLTNVTRSQVIEVMGEDIGRNIFFVPLSQRKTQLEQIPWVESASVMRFVPNRLRIEIRERTPVAFARLGSKISLIDASGALMDLPVTGKKRFSFPVILGMNLGEPQSTRAARMKIYNQLVSELDSSGAHYSQNLSEADLSDPDDVKVMASDPGGEVLVHLGNSDFLDRFKIYVGHVQEWRQQFARLDSVDLRYEHQIVVNPDLQGAVKQPPVSLSVAKAAMAAGVKPVVLRGQESVAAKIQSAATIKTAKPTVKPAKRKVTKARRRKPVLTKAAQRKLIQSAPPSPKIVGPPVTQTTANAVPPATQQTTTTSPATNPAKPGSKPSPSIPKGQVE
jgi:cell division protein FtsQ